MFTENRNIDSLKALTCVINYLAAKNYTFTTITPDSHQRVLARKLKTTPPKPSPRDVLVSLFGWSEFVNVSWIDPELATLLAGPDISERSADGLKIKSLWRVSSLDGMLFVHSSYPTDQENSIFFGPDSYRYVHFLKERVMEKSGRARRIVDIGAGTGVGGLCLGQYLHSLGRTPESLLFTDISPLALAIAKLNIALPCNHGSALHCDFLLANLFEGVPKGIDTVTANPPFIIDRQQRTYRHGGDHYGTQLSRNIISQSIEYLETGGQLFLYTGSPVKGGEDQLLQWIVRHQQENNFKLNYEEIDPDIFGEELGTAAYAEIDRIAAVGAVIEKL